MTDPDPQPTSDGPTADDKRLLDIRADLVGLRGGNGDERSAQGRRKDRWLG
jgi:hypothetical protein